jgi:hypothetical protein
MNAPERKIENPACGKCGSPTRLMGIEPHPSKPGFDVLTFQCEKCAHYTVVELRSDPSTK